MYTLKRASRLLLGVSLICFSPQMLSQAVFKCEEVRPGGKKTVVFSEKPCGIDQERLDLHRDFADDNRYESESGDFYSAMMLHQAELRIASEKGLVMEGMTESQVRFAWGSPSKINYGHGENGSFDQWVYRNHGGRNRDSYVYVRNGRVSSYDDARPPR